MSTIDPYLPPDVPTDNPAAVPEKKPTSTKRTLVIWIVLIAMFWVTYQWLKGPGARTSVPEEVCAWSPWSLWPLGLAALSFAWLWWTVRGGQRHQIGANHALLALADGELERARAAYAEQLAKQSGNQYVHSTRINLAWVMHRLGRFDEERELLLAVERAPGLFYFSEHRLLAAVYLAKHFAVRGDIARADAWLRDAHKRRARLPTTSIHTVAMLRLAEVLVLARKDADAEALAILDKDAARLEHGLTVAAMKPVLLLRAFLIARGGPREDGVAAQWLERAKPLRPDEVAYLWSEWPAMRTWAEAAGLNR